MPRYVFWVFGGAIILAMGFLCSLNFTTWPDSPEKETPPSAKLN